MEAIWPRHLYQNVTATAPASANQLLRYADNEGAISLAENARFHERTKHLDLKYHNVRDSIVKGLNHLEYFLTKEMTGDILTNALPRDAHQPHTQQVGLQLISLTE